MLLQDVGQTTIPGCFNVKDRKNADAALARCSYVCGLSFNLFRDPAFLEACRAVSKLGPSYKPPSSESVRTKLLAEEVKLVNQELEPIRALYDVYGCSITSDGWSSVSRRPLLNVLAVSPKGAEFLKAIDTTGESKTGKYIAEVVLQPVIEKVGHERVVQVIMDNASACQTAKEILEETFPDIFATNCAAHCLDLLLEDIGKLPWSSQVMVVV